MAIRFDEMAFRDAYKRLSREQKERFFPGGEEQAKKSIKSLVWLLGSDCGYDRLFVLYLTIAARIQLDIEPERISFTIKQRFSDLVPDSRISAVIACIERINENYAYIDRINSPEMKAKERTFDKQNEARFRENEKKFNDAERIPNFGIGIDNPIYAHFSFGSYRYLNLLYTDDITPLTWHRLGSYECDDCDDLLDKYDLLLPDGKVYLSIFINMYSRKESIFCPRGLIGKGLKTVPEIAPDNGEPSLEEIEEDVEDEEFSAFLQNYAKDAPKTAVPQAEESGSISVTPKEITESDQSEENVSHIESCSEPKELLYENLNPILLGSFPVILVMSMVFKQGTQIFARCSFLSISDKPIRAMQIDMQCYNVWHEGIQSVNGFEYLDLKVDRDQSFGADMVLPLPDPATRAIDIVIHRIAFADGTLLQRSGADNTAIPEMILLEKSLGSNELVHEYAAKTCQNVKYMPVRFGAFWRCTCGAINREDELICHKCADTAEVLFANLDQKTLQASVDKKKQIQKEKEEQERIEREQARRKAEEEESARKAKEVAEAQERAEKRRKRWKRFAIISSIIVAVALAAYLIGWQAIPAWKYNQAEKLLLEGDRDGAFSAFLGLADYRDSYSRANEIKYEDAALALSNGDYDSAFDTFNSIADYKDSQTQAKEAVYKKGMAVLNKAEFDTAYEAFSSISGYHDSDTMAKEAIYKKATVAFYKKDYDGAYTTYSSISDYGDSAIKAKESIYRKAALLMENGSFQEAADCFDLITDYRDSQAQSTICRNELDYLNATELLNKGSYSKAGECFESLGSYRDSDELMRKAYYLSAKELIDMGVLRGAYTVLNTKVNTDNRSYEDSVDLANSIGYQYADNCFNEGQYDAAMSIFEELADYEDSSARYLETKYQYGLSLIDDGRYEEAEQLFKELDNYKDSQTQNKEARYQRALIFLSKSDYTKAESLFEDLGNYKDSQTQLKEAKYQDALGYQYKLLRDYKRSVTIFKELGNYKDSVEQWKAAMYAYVKANYNNNNSTTYEYLTELKRYNYEDSKSCYEDLYTWKINGYVNTSKDDYSTHLTTITSYTKNVSFHYELSGGTPGEIISLYEITIFPDGSSMKSDYTFDDRMDGDTFCSYWNGYFMNNPEYGKAGILKSKLYNVKTGKLIGEVSVQVTS